MESDRTPLHYIVTTHAQGPGQGPGMLATDRTGVDGVQWCVVRVCAWVYNMCCFVSQQCERFLGFTFPVSALSLVWG
jgi:hypothetical protein